MNCSSGVSGLRLRVLNSLLHFAEFAGESAANYGDERPWFLIRFGGERETTPRLCVLPSLCEKMSPCLISSPHLTLPGSSSNS